MQEKKGLAWIMVSESFQGIMEASIVARAEASIEHEKVFYKYPSKHRLSSNGIHFVYLHDAISTGLYN